MSSQKSYLRLKIFNFLTIINKSSRMLRFSSVATISKRFKNSDVSVVLSEAPLAKLSHKLSFLSGIRKEAATKLKYLVAIW